MHLIIDNSYHLSVLLFTIVYSDWLIVDGLLLWENISRYCVAVNSQFLAHSQHGDNKKRLKIPKGWPESVKRSKNSFH